MRPVGYRASPYVADTGREPTKAIWDNIPWSSIEDGQREGSVLFDDFINFPNTAAADTATGEYTTFMTASGTIAQGADSEFGEAVMTLAAADNDEGYLGTGGNTGGLANFALLATRIPHTIAFECRVKTSTLLGSAFVGFSEEANVAADGLLDDDGTMLDQDFLGFYMLEATPTVWNAGYNKASGADPTTNITGVHTQVADEYVKLGLIYNYLNRQDRQIKWYVNGVKQGTYVTKAQIDDATNFPGGQEMSLIAAVKNITDIKVMTLDWWKFAQVVNA